MSGCSGDSATGPVFSGRSLFAMLCLVFGEPFKGATKERTWNSGTLPIVCSSKSKPSPRFRRKPMTRTTNARLAGFTFLAYIATGIASMVLFAQAATGANAAAKLASIAQHATEVRLSAVLTLLTFFEAVVLAVTLFALTYEE